MLIGYCYLINFVVQRLGWYHIFDNLYWQSLFSCRATNMSQYNATSLFLERENLSTDQFEYSRVKKFSSLVVIFNQENFQLDDKRRLGSTRDCNNLIDTLSRKGINIYKNYIYKDLNGEEIKSKIHNLREDPLLLICNSLIVFYLSHGDENDEIDAYDTSISTDDIIMPLSNCKQLKGKPKVFIFQACKGENFSTKDSACLESNIVPRDTFVKKIPNDVFIAYSSTEGNCAFRDIKYGSWFIQELCLNITAFGNLEDFVSIMIRVAKCVSTRYSNEEANRQMPLFISTLNKKFYLTRSKDRTALIDAIEANKKQLAKLDKILRKCKQNK